MLSLCCTDAATTEIYTLSLHDALPISAVRILNRPQPLAGAKDMDFPVVLASGAQATQSEAGSVDIGEDRKSTRLNSSHQIISYAVFCLKKKKTRSSTWRMQCISLG